MLEILKRTMLKIHTKITPGICETWSCIYAYLSRYQKIVVWAVYSFILHCYTCYDHMLLTNLHLQVLKHWWEMVRVRVNIGFNIEPEKLMYNCEVSLWYSGCHFQTHVLFIVKWLLISTALHDEYCWNCYQHILREICMTECDYLYNNDVVVLLYP